MQFIFFILFFMACQLHANPFSPALEKRASAEEFYFYQTPPFEYPFVRSSELDSQAVNIEKLSALLGSQKIQTYEEIFSSFNYDKKLNLYAYDFSVGTQWEFLPHPIITSIEGINPKDWINEFSHGDLGVDGIQSLDFLKAIDKLTDSESTAGNELEVLKTPNSLTKILSKMENAKNHVFMSSFLFQCDAGSEKVLSLMEKKIQQGVNIYLIIDKVFTLADRSCVKRLKSLGVHLGFQGGPLKIFHEKMYVFDGEYAVVDGQNMAAVQTLSSGSNNLINDMGIGLKGPIVQEVAQRFIGHWNKISKKGLPKDLLNFYAHQKSQASAFKTDEAIQKGLLNKSGVCRLVTSDPGFKDRKIFPLYLAYAKAARNYLFFNQIDTRFENVSGNSVGKNFLKEVVRLANANKDLRVDMLTNQWKLPTDIALPKGMGVKPTLFSFMITKPGLLIMERPHQQIGTARKNLIPLLEGDNLHWWASGIYMHAKTMMIDNMATLIGSYNINGGSENYSYEQVVVCHDEKLAESMQKSIIQDLLNSIPIPLKK